MEQGIKGLFVVGCPRSGTSRLRAAIIAHPQIALGLERYVERALAGELKASDFEINRFFSVQPKDTWYKDLKQFPRAYDGLEQKYKTASIHGDKIPRGFLVYDVLSRCFDKTYFLLCLRDIFSVAASYERRRKEKTDWSESWDYKMAVEHWNASIVKTLDAMQYMPILPVIYEDMKAGSKTVQRIGRFLQLDNTEPIDKAFSDMERSHKPTSEGDGLSEKATAYIKKHADFTGYKRLQEIALNPPEYNTGHVTRTVKVGVLEKYSKDDARVVDYQTWQLEGTPFKFRGPKPTAKVEDSIIFLGSAATFGRLVDRPFATTIQQKLGVPIFNLGIGGARPVTYLEQKVIVDMLERCKAVVVEVMSARGYKTHFFTPNHSATNMGFVPKEKKLKVASDSVFVDHVYTAAIKEKRHIGLFNALCQIRSSYLSDMQELARIVGKKAVLLYFSQREPDYVADMTSYASWSGGFPHFVDRRMMDMLKDSFKEVVQNISKTGLPSLCHDRITDELVPVFAGTPDPTHNTYYPSQEMNDEVAAKLLPIVKSLL